jgi:hypothetical protein
MTKGHRGRLGTACPGCLSPPLSLRARRGTSRRNHKGLCLARGLPRLREIERGTSTCFRSGSSASLPLLPLPPTEECLIETGTLRFVASENFAKRILISRRYKPSPQDQARNTLKALILAHQTEAWQPARHPTSFKRDTLQRNRAHSLARIQGD